MWVCVRWHTLILLSYAISCYQMQSNIKLAWVGNSCCRCGMLPWWHVLITTCLSNARNMNSFTWFSFCPPSLVPPLPARHTTPPAPHDEVFPLPCSPSGCRCTHRVGEIYPPWSGTHGHFHYVQQAHGGSTNTQWDSFPQKGAHISTEY